MNMKDILNATADLASELNSQDITTHSSHNLTTITFDRSKLYHSKTGQQICQKTLIILLGTISETIGRNDRQDTLTAFTEYGITVHDHYVHADGTNMFGPIPAADIEIN